jgi:hypothetical protein
MNFSEESQFARKISSGAVAPFLFSEAFHAKLLPLAIEDRRHF